MNGRLEEGGTVMEFLSRTFSKLPFQPKYGVLVTGDEPQESVAFEIAGSRSGSGTALSKGWSLDAIATRERAGLGIAKDLFASRGVELDAGVYAAEDYTNILRGSIRPQLGVGMHLRF